MIQSIPIDNSSDKHKSVENPHGIVLNLRPSVLEAQLHDVALVTVVGTLERNGFVSLRRIC